MTWFSLPVTQTDLKSAFCDSESAATWLAGQPQANAPAMLAVFVKQIEAFNSFSLSARERFKTMEVLRKTLFAVSSECQRRYEYKPLPLLPAEQTALDLTRRLWRASATGYLHCLRACLDGDSSLTRFSGKVAHRVMSCLRMEQMNCYVASVELVAEFWKILHSVLASAEQLGVEREPVEDRLLGETSESTVSGQYGMVLLLHLARPFSLSRAQFAAATRWLARWREQATILTIPDQNPKSCCIALDLSQDRPIHDNLRTASVRRWLSVSGVLRKTRKRIELLAAGESPESLKLGGGLSSEACTALLGTLSDHLKLPQHAVPQASADTSLLIVAAGLESIHHHLGGKGLKNPVASTTFGSQLSTNQIAIFGHAVQDVEDSGNKAETWRVTQQDAAKIHLIRPADCGDSRLIFRGLLAIQLPQQEHYALGMISSLYSLSDKNNGDLIVTANLFSGEPAPLLAEMRDRQTGQLSRHPAFLLPADEAGNSASVFLPAGLASRAASIRLHEGRTQSPLKLQLGELIERGGDNERWSLASA